MSPHTIPYTRTHISEYLLHYIWRTRQFDFLHMTLADGRELEVLDYGKPNSDSGPDFTHARIRVDGTLLAGHVELHVRSSEWNSHQHQHDQAYNSVILHVVYKHDAEVQNQNGHQLITLELKDRIDHSLLDKFELLYLKSGWIPCERLGPANIPPVVWGIWKERLNIERLQTKVSWVDANLQDTRTDWDEVMFRQVFRALGSNVNKETFSELSKSLEYKIFKKNISDPVVCEALLFGMAGLLETAFEESHPRLLKSTFDFLKIKYKLTPLNAVSWKYARMHPANFPDLRLAQAAVLLRKYDSLLDVILRDMSYKNISHVLNFSLDTPYWFHHYKLGIPSVSKPKNLGRDARDLLIINAVIPVLFMYGYTTQDIHIQEAALALLEHIPAENNSIIRHWHQLGISSISARDTQALIQLKSNYCDRSRCLHCSIGHGLLKDNHQDKR